MINTTDLFQMWRAVQDGSMTTAQARAVLVRAEEEPAMWNGQWNGASLV